MFILVEVVTEPDAGTIISRFTLGKMKVRDDDVTDVISATAYAVLFIVSSVNQRSEDVYWSTAKTFEIKTVHTIIYSESDFKGRLF